MSGFFDQLERDLVQAAAARAGADRAPLVGFAAARDGAVRGGGRRQRRRPTRARPLAFSHSAGGGFADELGADPLAGRTARRTRRGLTEYSGIAHGDVRTVTIATPRDIRTIRPSGRAHAFAAVYDGSFPTGEVVLTATFADGHTHRDVVADPGP